jgi:hypothetical protein
MLTEFLVGGASYLDIEDLSKDYGLHLLKPISIISYKFIWNTYFVCIYVQWCSGVISLANSPILTHLYVIGLQAVGV